MPVGLFCEFSLLKTSQKLPLKKKKKTKKSKLVTTSMMLSMLPIPWCFDGRWTPGTRRWRHIAELTSGVYWWTDPASWIWNEPSKGDSSSIWLARLLPSDYLVVGVARSEHWLYLSLPKILVSPTLCHFCICTTDLPKRHCMTRRDLGGRHVKPGNTLLDSLWILFLE